MASLMRIMSLLMCCTFIVGHSETQSELKVILDFISVVSGNWSNKAQIEDGSQEHDLIEGYVQQVEMAALPDKHLLFVEHSIRGQVVVLNVMEVTRDAKDKTMIRMLPYEFADPRKYKPGQFKVEDLQNLTRDQLKSDPDCVDNLVQLSDGVFSGICAVCTSTIGGKHPGIAVTLTCDECTGAVPLSVPARATSVPYIFRLIGSK